MQTCNDSESSIAVDIQKKEKITEFDQEDLISGEIKIDTRNKDVLGLDKQIFRISAGGVVNRVIPPKIEVSKSPFKRGSKQLDDDAILPRSMMTGLSTITRDAYGEDRDSKTIESYVFKPTTPQKRNIRRNTTNKKPVLSYKERILDSEKTKSLLHNARKGRQTPIGDEDS